MKRLSLIIFILTLTLMCAKTAFANTNATEQLEPVPFTIVASENDDFQPENEFSITFARAITINAETLIGAKVSVSVLYDGEAEPIVYEDVVVGATLKFIQPVALKVGDNTVSLKIEKEGYESVEIEALVKRKDSTIQNSLQNLIVIPGLMK